MINSKKIFQFLFFITISQIVFSQEVSFSVDLTADTIYLGNILKIKYTVENTQGDFVAPELNEWQLVGGPNTSSQFSMINGQVTQSASYEYILMASDTGRYLVPEARLNNGEDLLTTEPVWVTVLPNPDGIQEAPADYGFSQKIKQEKEGKPLSPQDSLKLKLRKLKSVRI